MVGCFSSVGSGKKQRFEHANADDAEGEEQPFLLPHPAPQPSSGEEPSSSFVSVLDTERDPVAQNDASVPHTSCKTFMFRELAEATKNFRPASFLGEGGFGKVYKGFLKSTGQVVAVKQLNRDGFQGEKEFLVEVLMLSQLQHPNLVNLIGFCRDGDERLLVYEYMPLGSLADHLHGFHPDKQPLDWNTRMKIAAGAAKGLKHLHHDNAPPVIFRDFKSANILLDKGFHPKLSDFGLAKYGPPPDKTHVSTRVMGTHGYCAPEYITTGRITVRSDVYSFGVVLLELITGRSAFDDSRARDEQHLVRWALPMLSDRKYLPKLADPKLRCRYSVRGLERALAVASRCIKEDAVRRPLIADVAVALAFLADEACNSSSAAPISGRRSGSRRDARPNPAVVAEQAGKVLASDDYGGSKNTEIIGILHNKDCDRAQVVAKAMVWAETWREKRQDIG